MQPAHRLAAPGLSFDAVAHGGERAGMAAFLGGGGGAKKRKLDRHKLLTESKLEPVTTWA